jgi:uncharacterized membrane protein YcaP (DUF421 family)
MDTTMLHHMFTLSLPVAEKILRPIVVYVSLIVGLRLAGKRELAELNPFDLVVLMTLSNTVQNAIIGDDLSITGGLIGAATLLGVNHLIARISFASPKLARLIEGEPTVLMEDGEIKEDRLRQELITRVEIETAAHKQGFVTLEDIDRAVLDPDGSLAFEEKEKTRDSERHAELLARLNRIQADLAALRSKP